MHRLKHLLLIFLSVFSTEAIVQTDDMPPAMVKVDSVQKLLLSPSMQLKGNVIAIQDAVISTEVTSLVNDVKLVGSTLRKGETIATLDSEKLYWQLQREQAQLASLRADMSFRQSEVERLQTLAKMDNAAKNQLQEALTFVENAKQQVLAAEANVAQAKRDVDDTHIKAPFDGVIVERYTNVGELLSVGEPVVRLVNQSQKEVVVPVPIRYQQLLNSGDNVVVDYRTEKMNLLVRDIVRIGDPNSRMVELRLKANDETLIVGDAITVFVPTAETAEELVVPRDALVIRGSQTYVYIVDSDSVAQQVMADIKYASGGWVALNGGVREGDKVIVRGAERIQPGTPVELDG